MIEIIYKDSGEKGGSVIVKPPKNIRQMGNPRGRHKIYIEDYVYTFLHSTNFENDIQRRAAVLLGKSEVSQDIRYTFISGAISCEDFIYQDEKIIFDESCWDYIYKEIKQYFDNQEIVGWFLGMSGFPLDITPAIEAAHRKYFTGRDKLLFLSEPSEGEDMFYTYEQGILQKKEGYYVYYEKNMEMQEYMVCMKEKAREQLDENEDLFHFKTDSEIKIKQQGEIEIIKMPEISKTPDLNQEQAIPYEMTPIQEPDEENKEESFEKTVQEEITKEEGRQVDEALRSYRSMLLEKKNNPIQKKMNVLLYTATAAAMVVLCVIGVTTLNNYEKMKQVEETLSLISSESPQKEEPSVPQNGGLVVESVPGEVEPVTESEEGQPDNTAPAPDENAVQETQGQAAANETTANSTDTAASADKEQVDRAAEEEPEPSKTKPEKTKQAEQSTEDKAQTSAQVTETSAQKYLEQGFYVVQTGDRLEAICRKIYQTTAMLDKLCEVNKITDVNKILVGQKLILP